MNELEFQIMDEVYFLCSFQQLLQVFGCNDEKLSDSLVELLKKDFIQQLVFDDDEKDYLKLELPDFSRIKSASYVATKKGLLEHNSR
ncbi:hypothetical protein LBMAG27_25140 [Bacteroidota bacterium]|nr:hypothetical protein LBMAG27_25140 [Bacteroidota bacterium]